VDILSVAEAYVSLSRYENHRGRGKKRQSRLQGGRKVQWLELEAVQWLELEAVLASDSSFFYFYFYFGTERQHVKVR
jgi:hypothetical protein